MAWERRRHPDLDADLNILLSDMDTEWNFTAGLKAADLLEANKPLTSKRFTESLIKAEGLNPDNETNMVRRVKRKFVQRYGHSVNRKDYSI
jgi:hypothetical protein